jgi:membrane protease YdiL (CAAX protease family)
VTNSTVTSDPIEHPTPGDTAYHRLGRTSPRYRWWKPLLVGLLGTVFYLVALVLLFLGAVLAGLAIPELERSLNAVFTDSLAFDLGDPVTLAVVLLSLIPLLPALLLATRIVGAQPVGLLSSVAGRLRWRWMLRCASIAAAVYLIGYVVMFAVSALGGESLTPDVGRPELPVLLVLIVLLVPLQSAAEEYVFRGYLMQTLGGWLRHPAFAILLPIPLFVIGHDYELIGMIDVGLFAAAAGWLTWRTGGLEAAIALHVVNNVSIFGLSSIGLVDPNGTDLGPIDLVFSLVMILTFVFVVTRLHARPSRSTQARYGRGESTL